MLVKTTGMAVAAPALRRASSLSAHTAGTSLWSSPSATSSCRAVADARLSGPLW